MSWYFRIKLTLILCVIIIYTFLKFRPKLSIDLGLIFSLVSRKMEINRFGKRHSQHQHILKFQVSNRTLSMIVDVLEKTLLTLTNKVSTRLFRITIVIEMKLKVVNVFSIVFLQRIFVFQSFRLFPFHTFRSLFVALLFSQFIFHFSQL